MQHIDERGQEQDVAQAIETILLEPGDLRDPPGGFCEVFRVGPHGVRGFRP